ncbi:protein lifeguard 1 isoform X2 [Leptopilina heterotoma]|nr:protein lifeguard 1 isoform X2 [Leptopilina heterotoma]
MYGSNYAEDPMHDEIKGFEFNDESIRRGFIRKVYSILMSQLLLSVGIIALFTYHMPTKRWFLANPATVWVALGVTLVLLICMACCSSVRRKAPMNFIFLGIFTGAESFLLGAISSRYEPEAVILAVGITAAVCFALTIFAFQTRFDFTALNGILFAALIVFVLFGIIAMFFKGRTITLVYASIGALLFSVYLVYDTQMMMGGKHKYSISPEEYVFAALNLYLDIVNIFLYILTIIGASRD